MLTKRSVQSVSLFLWPEGAREDAEPGVDDRFLKRASFGEADFRLSTPAFSGGHFLLLKAQVGMAVFPPWPLCGRCPVVPVHLALVAFRSVTGRPERTDKYLWVNKHSFWKKQR